MYRRLLITLLIAIFVSSLSWSTEAPAASAQSEDHRLPGLDGRVDAQFISAQKNQLSANVESALPDTFERENEFRRNVERFTCTSPQVAAVPQSRPLRI